MSAFSSRRLSRRSTFLGRGTSFLCLKNFPKNDDMNVHRQRHFSAPALQLQLPHPSEVLRDLEQPLLALLLDEAGPVHELLFDLPHCLFEVSRQFHLEG